MLRCIGGGGNTQSLVRSIDQTAKFFLIVKPVWQASPPGEVCEDGWARGTCACQETGTEGIGSNSP